MQGGEKQGKVQKLSKGEVLMLNIGSMCTGARVIAVRMDVLCCPLLEVVRNALLCSNTLPSRETHAAP